MKVNFPVRLFAIPFFLAAYAQVSAAQSCSTLVPSGTPTCTQVFSAVDVRTSQATAGYTGNSGLAPDIYGSSTVSLTCTASPIIATLSGPLMNSAGTAPVLTSSTATPPSALQAGGPLLVDNNLWVGVNGAAPTDVCTGLNQGSSYLTETVPSNEAENCFESPYSGAIGYPTIPSPLNGDDPDTTIGLGGSQTVDVIGGLPITTFPSGGVGAIDISGLLTNSSTAQSVTIQLQDDGGVLTSSSVFLATNCTVGPVTGPALVTGNTVTTSNPSTLTQTFDFDSNNGDTVGFVYNLTPASTAGTLTSNSLATGPTPQTADLPVDPATFQPDYAEDTSFATSNCLVHTGEALYNGSPACKLYTLECTTGTGAQAAGALCPVSTVANEVVQDIFDGPQFSLQNIYTPFGTFREGIGLLMASEEWGGGAVPPTIPTGGGPCIFDPNSGAVATLPCPQNLLTSFSGPGTYNGRALTTNPNSSFISVYGVPEDFTTVFVAGERPGNWVNSDNPKVYFFSQAPNFTKGAYVQNGNKQASLPNASSFIPQPIQSITYGISPVGSVPLPINEPITTDTPLYNSATTCPAGPLTATSVPSFAPSPVTLSISEDGQYLIHYYATDCAGTQELSFTQAGGSWSTSFFTYPVNVDTIPPAVSPITLSPASSPGLAAGTYKPNTIVTASYSCSDAGYVAGGPNTGSGVVQCGANNYPPESEYATPTLTYKFSVGGPAGKKSFTVFAVDGAGNISSASVTYTVN